MSRAAIRLVPHAGPAMDEPEPHPAVTVSDEVIAATLDLDRHPDDYFRFPWSGIADVVGGMPPGEVCYIGAFSGHGKTTFLTSLTDVLFEQTERKVYYMGLESKPKTLRTHWACKRLGYDAGYVLSGDYLERDDASQIRERIQAELLTQGSGDKFRRVRFCPTPYVSAESLWREAERAAEFGAHLVIIDHVDHIGGDDRKNAWEQSVAVNRAILEIAQEYGFLMLPATQFNNDAVRNNRAALHVAPQPQFVKMGGHKREVATWMLGLYKPLKLAGVDKDALARFNATGEGYKDVLEPNCMAVSVMKHRLYGNREGARGFLRVQHGRVVDLPERAIGGVLNGIRTARGI